MPTEHRLIEAAVPAAIFGKHPGHGDFVSAGLPDGLGRRLSDWLGATLGEVRDLIGPAWDEMCQSPTALRFWLGAHLGAGSGAWRGVMRMSGDKVGRSYPLLILQPASPDSLPAVQPGQDFYLAAEQALGDLLDQAVLTLPDASAVVAARLSDCPGADRGEAAHEHMFWATRATPRAEELCADIALTDLICGATARSYWWFANGHSGQSGILGCQDLPDARAMTWLITGGATHETEAG